MSFNRLNYDACTYEHNLKQSVGVGHYQLDTPSINCQSCFVKDPAIRQTARGVSYCSKPSIIDASSELLGLPRKASNCPKDKYFPSSTGFCTLQHLEDCKEENPQESTRLSNPPCTLRSTGWNRWEWLCRDPQAKALVPFDYNISNRIIVKDNHRPCIPEPLSACEVMPSHHHDDAVYMPSGGHTQYAYGKKDIQIPSTHWKKCESYSRYFN